MWICYYSNQEWYSFPSQNTLSENIGVSINSIKKYLRELEDMWILKRERRYKDWSETSSMYQLVIGISTSDTGVYQPVTEGISTSDTGGVSPDAYRTISTSLTKSTELTSSKEEEEEPMKFWKDEINLMQKFLRQAVWVSQFKDAKERWYVTHCYNLMKKIWKDEFQFRLREILSDPFKQKNSNKLAYLYWELKSFIHTPVVEPKKQGDKIFII